MRQSRCRAAITSRRFLPRSSTCRKNDRHPGLDPGSRCSRGAALEPRSGTPGQARGDGVI
ncbi:MAG: hypothetical protein C0515_04135 [Novosphingobium sp.]|nr:hypothetical protein [Novosphingobium sp.]